MTSERTTRSVFGVAAVVLLAISSADAYASKEKFVRDKPHMTVDAQAEDKAEEKKKEKKGTKVRKPMQDVKSSRHGDEPGTLKGETKTRAKKISGSVGKGGKNKKKDKDVADKTDKSEAARAKRKN